MDAAAADGADEQPRAGPRDARAGFEAESRRDLAAAVRGLRPEERGDDLDQQSSEALARIHGASDLLKFSLQRIDELEAWNREVAETSQRRLEALEREVVAAERRAAEEDEAARRAEDWLRRIHGAVLDHLQPGRGP